MLTMTTSIADLRRIFVDTSAWLALANPNDRGHIAAVGFQRALAPGTKRLTAWGVVSETYTWLRYYVSYHHAQRWLLEEAAAADRGVLEVVFPVPAMESAIRLNLSRFSDQELSYVDAHSLAVLQSRNDVDAVFTLDHHLMLAGLPVFPG
jgi:predicted nucleic acid-binding protein